MSDDSACLCEVFEHPRSIANPPDRPALSRRVGDYATFRHALLRALDGESELGHWRPAPEGDLAVQLVEWWAYLSDILTFYDERVANETYLRTAAVDEDVRRLIRLLGYRPRPGIGAQGQIAASVAGPRPPVLPQGMQITSKPVPGQQPQTFELDADVPTVLPESIEVDPPADTSLAPTGDSVLLRGASASVRKGDRLLLLPAAWDGTSTRHAFVTVVDIAQEKEPRGKTNTRLTFGSLPSWAASVSCSDYRLLRATATAHLWQYLADSHALTNTEAHLESVSRQMKAGDPACFELAGDSSSLTLVQISKYAEAVWFANGVGSPPTSPPTDKNVPGIPIPHTVLTYGNTGLAAWSGSVAKVTVSFGWQDVGELMATPAASVAAPPARLVATGGAVFPSGAYRALIEDANGNGALVKIGAGAEPSSSALVTYLTDPVPVLKPPLKVWLNVLDVSRGKSVSGEVLGSGDASQSGQEFVLAKSPLTYLLAPGSGSGDSWRSTLRVWVDGIEWQEAPTFFAQPANAHMFVTREDEAGKTHAIFGDGVNGARLPTGANNIVASYRHESGAQVPDVGALNVISQPKPGLRSLRSPVQAGSGADPDPASKVRRYGPLSATTFGRAVSADDYQTIAAQTPGVSRARAYFRWDAEQQRPLVIVYVGDNSQAVDAARKALRLACDPNRPPLVAPAAPVPIAIRLAVKMDPARDPAPVLAGVRAALADPDTGLFGANVVRIGQTFFDSQIDAACLSVPGVIAIHHAVFLLGPLATGAADTNYRHVPGEGGFFQLSTDNLDVTAESGSHG